MRFYHFPVPKKKSDRDIETGGGIEAGPDRDKPDFIPIPRMFGGGEIPLKKGGIAFGFVGHGFWHVGPNEFVDLPDSLSNETVRNKAPQLITKAEAIRAGLVNEDGSMKATPKDKTTSRA